MHSSAPPQIPGELIPNEDAYALRHVVADLLERGDNVRFPGAQPVSFAREHISELKNEEYFMCEKTDGVRCLLFLHYRELSEGVFAPATLLIDRKNNYYDVQPPLVFPHHKYPNDRDKYLFSTLLDGELVHDRVHGQPKPELIFYVFDCLTVDGQNVTMKPLDKRIGSMKEYVFKPYDRYKDWVRKNKAPMAPEPFRVKEKKVYPPYSLKVMFEDILPHLPHGNDGLVFTCKRTPYKFGTDPNILKWKPPHENTIDFKLRLGDFPRFDPEDGEEGLIPDYDAPPLEIQLLVQHNKGDYRFFAYLAFTPQDWETLKSLNQRLDGRIIECYRDNAGNWRFKTEHDGTPRWRDDKKDANHISTVNSVLDSINNPVTEQDLLAESAKIKEAVYRIREQDRQQQKRIMAAEQEREAKKRKFNESDGGQ